MTPFADNFPDQFIETGIAEQNLVSICLLYTSKIRRQDVLIDEPQA